MARKKRKYSYWEQRRAREMFDLMETAEETASELKGLYYKASAETESEAIRAIKRFQLKNHLSEKEAYALLEKTRTPDDIRSAVAQLKKNPKNAELAAEVESPAYAARVRELQGVQAKVDQTVKDLYRVTKTKTDDTLDYIAKESYYREMFSLQQQVGEAFPIQDITAEDLERIVRTRWSGASYSERIWENTQELADAVKEEMLLSVLTGKSLNRIARDIQKKFGGTFNSARRLVRTEACYVTNQIQLEAFRRTGVKEYIYSAILDERTSEICRDLDGQRFKVKNAKVGVTYPPMHPWCRSSVVAAMPESLIDRLKRKARDFWGKIIKVTENTPFSEWANSFFKDEERRPNETSQDNFATRYRDIHMVDSQEEQYDPESETLKQDSSSTVVEGKDIVNTWTRRSNEFMFEIDDAIDAQGFNGLPKVVSSEEFDEAVKLANGGDGFIAQRTYSAPSQEILDSYRDKLYNGEWYVDCSVGGAQYGKGMYCVADYTGELTDGIINEMSHYRELGESRFSNMNFSQRVADIRSEDAQKAYENVIKNANLSDDEELILRANKLYTASDEESDKAFELLRSMDKDGRSEVNRKLNEILEDAEKAKTEIMSISIEDYAEMKDIKLFAEPVSYTETMTLDPSAKIINFKDLVKLSPEIEQRVEANAFVNAIDKADMLTDKEKAYIIFRSSYYEEVGEYKGLTAESTKEWWMSLSDEAKENVRFNTKMFDALKAGTDAREAGRKFRDMDYGTQAVLLGYDGINAVGHGESGSYTVILNRTKVIIRGTE